MTKPTGLLSPGFLTINAQFALVTGIAALFFAFSGYLQQLGVAPATAGFILSADALAALIVQPLISPLIHGASARRWLIGGSLLLCAALYMLSEVSAVPLLIAARLAQGTGFICVLSALIALMVDVIPPQMSGRAFGWASLVRLLPYALIPWLFDRWSVAPEAFTGLLKVAALVALAPLLALLLPATPGAGKGSASAPPGGSGMAASLRSRPVVLLLAAALLFYCGYSAIFFFLKQFGQSRGIANANLFFTVTTLVMIAARLGGSGLFDRYSKPLLGGAGLLIAALCYALLPLSGSGPLYFALAALTGLGWGVAMPLQAAAMFDVSESPARAMNQNLLVVMMQGGFFLGPLAGGLLIDAFGYPALFVGLAAATLAAALLMLGVKSPAAAAEPRR